MTQETNGRKGRVFALRLTDVEREALEREHEASKDGPRAFGPWLLWRALGNAAPGGHTRARGSTVSSRGAVGNTRAPVIPELAGSTLPRRVVPPPAKRIILDLCAGSGAWSEPYKRAGYKVVRVSLPKHDVRTFAAPRNVDGPPEGGRTA